MESGGKNEGPTTTKRERRKWIGGTEGEGREGKRKGFAGPMSNCFLRPCSIHVYYRIIDIFCSVRCIKKSIAQRTSEHGPSSITVGEWRRPFCPIEINNRD